MTQSTQNGSMGTLTQDLLCCSAVLLGISHVRKALAAGWRWGFTHRNPALAGILAGDVWAEWWHSCMSQMMDSVDWESIITNVNTTQVLQQAHRVHNRVLERVCRHMKNKLCFEERLRHLRSSLFTDFVEQLTTSNTCLMSIYLQLTSDLCTSAQSINQYQNHNSVRTEHTHCPSEAGISDLRWAGDLNYLRNHLKKVAPHNLTQLNFLAY